MENKMTPKQALEELQVEWEFNNKELPRGFVDTRYEIIEKALTEHEKLKEIIVGMYEATCNMLNYLEERLKNPKNLVDENNLLRMRGEKDAYKKIINLFEDKKSVENYIEQGLEIAHLKLELVNYKKLKKALEIIKEILDDDLFSKLNSNSRKIIKEIIDKLPKEKLDLLKEVLE